MSNGLEATSTSKRPSFAASGVQDYLKNGPEKKPIGTASGLLGAAQGW